ncbi:MAG TPA: hydroxymethylglutaryl-CoA lyase, partial [Vicinamibacterales bacterium]|nr:hydroxymethylglutaryl-CoA lyase [Vicinamibacterales bacterium]
MRRPPLPSRVRIVEVGPRDGLQNERAPVDTATKVALVDALTTAGLPVIEVGAFVSPRWVPQMANTADVFQSIKRAPGVAYTALVPNTIGLRRAIAAGVTEVAVFAAASETFSARNISQTVEESLKAYADVAREALENGLRVRAYLSTAFGCPYEGHVPVTRVVDVAVR